MAFSLEATITVAVADTVTFAIVRAISTIAEIGDKTKIISIGNPAAVRTAVAAMVAVPGTPAVPNPTINV